MSDYASIFDTSYDDIDSMTDAELREWHQRMCDEGDGWSHGFEKLVTNNQKEHIIGQYGVVTIFTKENWQKMGEAISQSTSLTSMNLDRCNLSQEGIEALFGGERTFNCPLNALILNGNQLGPSGIAAMLPFLKSISTLNRLDLDSTELDVEGARLLSEALNHVRVDRLSLRENDIGDEGVEHLLSAQKSVHLIELDIIGNEIGRRGFQAISQFLGRDDTALKTFSASRVEEENAKMLIDSISHKSKLEYIILSASCPMIPSLHTRTLPNFQKLVCDISSFESLCQSNHQLKYSRETHILNSNPTLKEAFDINDRSKHGASIVQRLRSKLRAFYFQGEFDVHPFVDMNVKLMPNVLELVTKTEICVGKDEEIPGSGKYYEVCSDDLNGVYRVVRNCHLPELFSFPSPESKMQYLEAEITKLRSFEVNNAALEADNASLKQEIDQLMMENEDLRAGKSALPNERTKSSDN